MHHLKRCPTELEREPIFEVDLMEGRDWVWCFVEKIQALKAEKIVWPDDNFGGDLWIITVDGPHCWISEPGHPVWSQDSSAVEAFCGNRRLCVVTALSGRETLMHFKIL